MPTTCQQVWKDNGVNLEPVPKGQPVRVVDATVVKEPGKTAVKGEFTLVCDYPHWSAISSISHPCRARGAAKLPARADNRALVRRGGRKAKQLAQSAGTGPMHRRTYQHLDGFQVQRARFAHAGEDGAQQLLYFARDFLLDGVRRFFSCSLCGCSSTGRRRQIFSFTSRRERLSS